MDTDLFRTVDGRYGRVTYFANDIGAGGQSLQLYGEWAEQELSFLQQFVELGSVVLDVGAYVGTHTLAFARFVGADGCIVAFEPQPATFEVLKKNVSANHLSNVRLVNAAVADRAGSMAIPALDIARAASFGSTSLKTRPIRDRAWPEERETAKEASAEVPVVIIDDLDLKKCSLIKIDAESMESAVIRGAARTLRRLAPVVYAECNSVEDGLSSLAQLRELGYEVRLHLVDAFSPNNFLGAKNNIFGSAREAALVGVPLHRIDLLNGLSVRACELLVRLETADDLVLGLLNKPQYTDEILRPSAAAKSGAVAWLGEIERLHRDFMERETALGEAGRHNDELATAVEHLQQDLAAREAALGEAGQRNDELATAVEHLRQDLAVRDTALGQVRNDLERAEQVTAELEEIASAAQAAVDELRNSVARAGERQAAAEREREMIAEERARISEARDRLRSERDHFAEEAARWFDAAIYAALEPNGQNSGRRGLTVGRFFLALGHARGRGSPMQRADKARDARQWERAARYYLEALSLMPGRAAVWVQLGHALKEAGKTAEAEIAYRRAVEFDENCVDALIHLGQLLRRQVRNAEAITVYNRALEIAPHGELRSFAVSELSALGYAAGSLSSLVSFAADGARSDP